MNAAAEVDVCILGAGLAGMVAAYELRCSPLKVIVLEAQQRSGGRCRTLRNGDVVSEGKGTSVPVELADGLYFNPGPARIPQHHSTVGLCHELGVTLEPFINFNANALLFSPAAPEGQSTRIRFRELEADSAGYLSELAMRSTQELRDSFPAATHELLVPFLREYGALTADPLGTSCDRYIGSSRSGFIDPPSEGVRSGTIKPPQPLEALLKTGLWRKARFLREINQQTAMLQIRGGVDGLAKALEAQVGSAISFGTKVQGIENRPDGGVVEVRTESHAGAVATVLARRVICTIPLTVLRDIPSNFRDDTRVAIEGVHYESACKLGIQTKRRFWESEGGTYGGVTFANLGIGQVWYPSADFGQQRGVLLCAYNFGDAAREFAALDPAGRFERVLREASQIHPELADTAESAAGVAWDNEPHARGAFAEYTETERRDLYPILLRGDGCVRFAGEHMSYLTGWMAGAIDSGRAVARQVVAELSPT